MNIKKLLLFLSACSTPIALAMDKKTPKPLVYLAALKVNPRDLPKLPKDVAQKTSAIQNFDSELKLKLNSAEKEHYNVLLENICTKKRANFTLEDVYKLNPSLVVSQQKDIFVKCILNDNRAEAEWLLAQFPSLLDLDIKRLLEKSIGNGCINSFSLLSDKLFERTPIGLHSELTKTIVECGEKHRQPVTRWLVANQIPYSDADKFLHALAIKDLDYIKEQVSCLDPIVKEQKYHVVLKGLFKDITASGNATDIISTLSKNSDFIKLVQSEIRNALLESNITIRQFTQLLHLCSEVDQPIKDHLTSQLRIVLQSNITGQTSKEVALLIKYGANPCHPMALNRFGTTVLPVVYVMEEHNSYNDPKVQNIPEEKRKIVQILLSKNPQEQINHYKAENTGNNLLCCKNSHHYIDILTSAGCFINERNNLGETPLYRNIFSLGHTDDLVQIAEKFLFYGADPYAGTNNGNNLFSWLCRFSDDEYHQYNTRDVKNLLFGTKKLTWTAWFKLHIGKPISMLTWDKQKAHPFENATMKIDSKKTVIAPHNNDTQLAAVLRKSALMAASKSQTSAQKHQSIAAQMEDID